VHVPHALLYHYHYFVQNFPALSLPEMTQRKQCLPEFNFGKSKPWKKCSTLCFGAEFLKALYPLYQNVSPTCTRNFPLGGKKIITSVFPSLRPFGFAFFTASSN